MTSAYTINLNPNITTPVKTGYTFKAGDKGITFNIVVKEMDDATGMTAKICFMRANGASVEATLTGTGPTFSYTTLGNEFAVPGVVVADVKFYNSTTQRYSTASFVFNVIGDTLDGIGAGTGGYSDQLETLSAEFSDTLHEYQDAFGLVGAIIPRGAYNSATQYSALDLVSYSGSSWLCREGCKNQTPSQGSQYWQLFASGNDYASLTNKPSINGVTLATGQTSSDLGLLDASFGNVDGIEADFTYDSNNITYFHALKVGHVIQISLIAESLSNNSVILQTTIQKPPVFIFAPLFEWASGHVISGAGLYGTTSGAFTYYGSARSAKTYCSFIYIK